MSTLEKAIGLLRQMPEPMVEAVYGFMQSMSDQEASTAASENAAFGIAHKYADPSLIGREKAFNADTLAALDEVREMEAHPEKYKSYHSFSELLSEVLGHA